MDFATFTEVFSGLWTLKKGRVPTDGPGRVDFETVATGYYDRLRHLPDEILREAIAGGYDYERMPSPAQLRELANQTIRKNRDEAAVQKRLKQNAIAALPAADNPAAAFAGGGELRGDDRPLLTLEELAQLKAGCGRGDKVFAPVTEGDRRYDARQNVVRFVRSLAYWQSRGYKYPELQQRPLGTPTGDITPSQAGPCLNRGEDTLENPPEPANETFDDLQGGDLEFLPFAAGDTIVTVAAVEDGPTVGEIGHVQDCRLEGNVYWVFASFSGEPHMVPESAVEFLDGELEVA